MSFRLDIRTILGGLLLIAVFVFASHVALMNKALISTVVLKGGWWAGALFVLISATFIVFVIPLDIAFLIPIGVQAWGPLTTGLLSITGWTLGGSVAFGIARLYGRKFVARIIGEANVERARAQVPQTGLFWSVTFLRMMLPVDLFSYALGLFAPISWPAFTLATAIGVTPFAFYFAYVGALGPLYQVLAIAVAFIFAGTMVWLYRRRTQRK